MTSRAPLRCWLVLALVGCALAGSHARAQSADSEPEWSDAQDQEASSTESAPDDTTEPAAGGEGEAATEGASLQVEPFVGAGIGTRALERPTETVPQRMDTTVFPALDTGLRVTGWPGAAFSLGVLLHYQTSLGMTVREQPPFALYNDVDVRSEHIELSAAPTFRLGDAEGALALAFPIGFTIRTFWPEVHHSMTPGYSLGGPLARAELIVPIGEAAVLRIGPEFQWIVMIDHALTDAGVAPQAVGLGGEATLAVRLSTLFALQLDYREVHVLAPNDHAGGQSFSDVERFLTLGLSGRL